MKIKITDADCRACGACCVASGNGGDVLAYGYADLTDKDVERMSPRVRKQLHEIFIGGETRHATKAKQLASGALACQHLRGTPGQRCSCSIYTTRPEVCSKFRVGGEMCRAARQALTTTSLP
jgi:Fe-S-cluster containining protein